MTFKFTIFAASKVTLFTIKNLIFHKNLARIDLRQKKMIEFDIPNYRRIDSKLYEKEKRKLLVLILLIPF